MRRTALTAVSLVLGLTATLAAAAPAGAVGPEIPIKGQATFCLGPAAASALTAEGVTMTATAPATLDASGPTPCVTTPVSQGSLSADLLTGGAPLDGGFSFTRTGDQSRLDFTNLYSDVTRRTITVDAAVDGAAPTNIDLATYQVTTDHVQVGLTGVDASGLPASLAPGGAGAFVEAFDAQPVATGEQLFTISGHVDLIRSVLAVPAGLTH